MSGYWGGKDFKLTINTDYLQNGIVYNGTDGPDCGGIPADRLITHEMTHGLMFANTNSSSQPPFWIVEGLAEAVHGASDIRFNEPVDDAGILKIAQDIINFNFANSDGDVKAYSVGYLATSYVYTQMEAATPGSFKTAMADLKNQATNLQTMANTFKTEVSAIKDNATALKTYFESKCKVNLNDKLADALTGDASSSSIINNSGDAKAPTGTTTNFVFETKNIVVNWGNKTSGGDGGIVLQIGDTNDQTATLSIDEMTTTALGIDKISAKSQTDAQSALKLCKDAINAVSASRSNLGAFQNRLEHTMANLQMTQENITSSESRIRDTDMASEMMNMVKRNVLVQASEALFAQVSQNPSKVLQLLQ